ncbi:tRNA uridine-5-carboxymethylaminomethyl(34) synthesis GTPase MnmE [Varunaivibrio sulfuroxidans]|uniref:tRNA modification GTPase MnmE n=1 Tax=Varunaivibrio sulfuroxidans TaxID=1773489 RepID=A0A4R3JHW5_9PROT|nr:tRNA uridine-5-carboxymethylaminomethyl(34) synthesis GTPase MnmE [Varunaivibrio sulfuroxidans]TCS64856.1 tRNA modification GTPase trmE [Varunaivibrio sulfuroxidans]WES29845.1 tRNA uridine-5-carboxymethylaminomethyl(34) synthesis GTPase MnmE [Varunaivibrio sulfuroxidans]
MSDWTIYAPASAPGRAGVAVFRVSGPACRDVFFKFTGQHPTKPRFAYYVELTDPVDGGAIDDALALFFQGPASFTGEDVVEFHVHGSSAVMHKLSDVLSRIPGVRLADPGEFTRRAFENGKMDLTRAEGLADLIDAETEAQRKQALRQSRGALAVLYDGWRDRLLSQRVRVEALIDFSDQEDVSDALSGPARDEMYEIMREIERHLDDGRRGERLRSGVHLAIVGPPNAGKSSLLNALSNRDAAIVSEKPGTTRDVIELRLDLGGYPVVIADTAGIRRGADSVEEEGVRRARVRAAEADICLFVYDASDPATWEGGDAGERTDVARKEGVHESIAPSDIANVTRIIVFNKVDRVPGFYPPPYSGGRSVVISLKTNEGMEDLLSLLENNVRTRCESAAGPGITRQRHRECLQATHDHLRRALDASDLDLCAEDLRLSLNALGRITGRVDVEDLLDVVFRDFCIGK